MKSSARLLLATVTLYASLPVQAETEVQRLRNLVAEQERQIRMLEEENSQLRADMAPRGSRSLKPTGSSVVSASPAPVARETTPARREHTVAAGDSLAKIGREHGVSAEAVAAANGMNIDAIIRPGQKLKIPEATRSDASAASTVPVTRQSAKTTANAPTHTVQAGETFYSISRQHGISVDRLISANPDAKPSALRVGQKLRLADEAESPTAARDFIPVEESPNNTHTPDARTTENRRPSIRTIKIDGEMTYGAFAAKHGTTPERLNQLNGLDLDARTVLAKGSELYAPAQP